MLKDPLGSHFLSPYFISLQRLCKLVVITLLSLSKFTPKYQVRKNRSRKLDLGWSPTGVPGHCQRSKQKGGGERSRPGDSCRVETGGYGGCV